MPSINRRRAAALEKTADPRRTLLNWLIVLVVVLAVVLVVIFVKPFTQTKDVAVTQLICSSDQDVTVFGDSVLYYDGITLHCVAPTGGIRWSFPVGNGARFSASDTHIVIWAGAQLFIIDKNGKPSYSETMSSAVQFARVNDYYCAVVIGGDTTPDLIVKSLDGTQVDEEVDAFNSMLLLDVGFYGDNDQYMWTLAMDVYGTAINTVLNTFQVGKMNTGQASLGEFLAYKVMYANNKLYVFTTQRMFVYDYKAVPDQAATQLVYGWQYLDSTLTQRGATMLLAPTAQLNGSNQTINDLRVLTETLDQRFTLPSACVGAALHNGSLYAVSPEYLYRNDMTNQRFALCTIPLPEERQVTGFIGITSNNRVIVTSGSNVYSVSIPW